MESEKYNVPVAASVTQNFTFLQNLLGNGFDLVNNRYDILENRLSVGLIYIDSMTDKQMIQNNVLLPMLKAKSVQYDNPVDALNRIQVQVISATNTEISAEMPHVTEKLLQGWSVLFLEGAESALLIGTRRVEKRAVEAPENEATVLASQESFTDDLLINTCLVIKRLPVPGLHIEEFTVGKLSRTKVKLLWIKGVADPNTIEEVRKRISKIDVDNIDGIGALGELIEDDPISIFPKNRQTERPDVVARRLSDGRFAILCSNSPFALFAPSSLWDNFRTMDDYEERPAVSSYLRIVRYTAFGLSILISGIYLSFVSYNHAIVPPALALNIAAGREGVPFPSIIELLLLTFAISIIREAGLRMPGSVGYFVGTLAAVVIGQAIVTAGYVSPSLIIVVAVSTISSFAISTTSLVYPARFLNYFFILLAGFFGIYGMINGIIIFIWHLCSLNSFGVPYLYPVLPFDKNGFKDVFWRSPYKFFRMRLKRLAPGNRTRVGTKGMK